ncbi:MAG TPA: cyclase family protein [Chloroflexota bacterium]|jgi:hypothetical protein
MQPGWVEQYAPHLRRRDFIQGGLMAGVAAGLAGALAAAPAAAGAAPAAQAQQTPIGPQWWPSRWGADDEAGASNWMTPDKVLKAASLIKKGKIYNLDHVYERTMPLFGQRVWTLRMPGAPTGGPFGDNKLIYNDEFLTAEIGQVGTQFDGLGHIGVQVGAPGDQANMRYYNGFTEMDLADPYGLKKLGIEKVKPFFTRGVLADIAGLKGRMLDVGEEVSLADVRAAFARVGVSEASLSSGDGVFFNTGWSRLWGVDNDKFNSGEPGIGLEVARWCAEKQLALVGSDVWATEAVPNPNPNLVFAVHNELITKNGIFNHENLDFSGLLADGVYEFVYVFAPMRIKGATGSAGHPIAIT